MIHYITIKASGNENLSSPHNNKQKTILRFTEIHQQKNSLYSVKDDERI
jgi:hypothetical protein